MSYNLAYVTYKKSCFGPRIKDLIGRISQGGFFFKWYNDMLSTNRGRKGVSTGDNKKFSLTDLQLVFYELIIGYIISILTFLAEILFYRCRKR